MYVGELLLSARMHAAGMTEDGTGDNDRAAYQHGDRVWQRKASEMGTAWVTGCHTGEIEGRVSCG
jgi:hypothetical protein